MWPSSCMLDSIDVGGGGGVLVRPAAEAGDVRLEGADRRERDDRDDGEQRDDEGERGSETNAQAKLGKQAHS